MAAFFCKFNGGVAPYVIGQPKSSDDWNGGFVNIPIPSRSTSGRRDVPLPQSRDVVYLWVHDTEKYEKDGLLLTGAGLTAKAKVLRAEEGDEASIKYGSGYPNDRGINVFVGEVSLYRRKMRWFEFTKLRKGGGLRSKLAEMIHEHRSTFHIADHDIDEWEADLNRYDRYIENLIADQQRRDSESQSASSQNITAA
jgi:hypothetical protein